MAKKKIQVRDPSKGGWKKFASVEAASNYIRRKCQSGGQLIEMILSDGESFKKLRADYSLWILANR